MSIPTIDELSDDRICQMQNLLTQMIQAGDEGFANNMIWKKELACLLIEVRRSRQHR